MAHIQTPYSWIELRLAAKDLPRMDVLSKSDPMAVVQLGERGQFVEIGRTECIKDDQSPTWHTPIRVQYKFEVNQTLRVLVYDVDPDKLDFMGKAECSVADVVAARGNFKQVTLNNDTANAKKAGVLMLKAEEMIDSNSTIDAITFFCRGVGLDKKDTFGKSDPYYNVFRCRSDGGEPTLVRKSEVIKNTLNPDWLPQRFTIQELCNGDYNRPLLIEVWDWDKHTKHDLIGTFRTTLQEILNGKNSFEVIHPEKQRKKKSYKNSGTFMLTHKVHNKVSFLNYLKNGVQLNFTVAVDFTASNGDPKKPGTLHYTGSGANEYQQAIAQIGTIVSPYDIDQKFPVFGFGGKYRGHVNHCFPLNGNDNNPEVVGLPGIMTVYSEAIYKYELYGPTLFQNIIAETVKQATFSKNSQASRNYTILLILTDGQINDMDQTILQVIRGSSLPMSIIIVGVGNADFSSMETLDSDDKKLTISGQTAARDIVQFVPFSRFKSNPELLANETLAEVPRQVCEYYQNIMLWEPPLHVTTTTVTTTTTVAPNAYMAPAMQFLGQYGLQPQQYAPQPGYPPQQQYAYPPQGYYPPQPQPGQPGAVAQPGVVAQPQPGVVAQPLPGHAQPGLVAQPQPGQPGVVSQPLPGHPQPGLVAQPQPGQPGVVSQPLPGQPGVVVQPQPGQPGVVAHPQPGQPQQYAYPPQGYYYPPQPQPGQPGAVVQPGQPGTVAHPQPGVVAQPQPGLPGVVAQPQPGTVAQPGVVAQPGAVVQPGQPGTVAQPQPGVVAQPGQQYPPQGYYYPPQQYAYPPQQPGQPGAVAQPGVVAQPQPGVVAQPQPTTVAQPDAKK